MPVSWLARLLRHRKVEIDLSDALERRLKLYMDRSNHEGLDDDPLDLDSDEDLAIAILSCTERGLELDESEHGLAGSVFGDVLSADVMEEGRRRRKELRDRIRQQLRGEEGQAT